MSVSDMKDSPRAKAALDAYQDAMRRCQTWRNAVRAALAAADAVGAPAPAEPPLHDVGEQAGWVG